MLTGCTKGSITELSFEEYQTKIENKDSFILVLAQTTCSHCKVYKKYLNEIIKEYDVDIYLLNVDKITKEEENILTSLFTFSDGISTPTTIFVENGIETSSYDRIVGSSKHSTIVEKFKNKGYIG